MKIALIDADGLLYHSSKTTLEESITSIDERIENIIEKTNCDFYALFLSDKITFRHKICPEYKANRRKYKSRLLWLKTLKAYLIEKYNAYTMDNAEADDLVAYFHYNKLGVIGNKDVGIHIDTIPNIKGVEMEDIKYEEAEVIICSTDKDLLSGIAGKHFNYTYYLEEEDKPSTVVKGYWEGLANEPDKFIWYQMLIGDAADNITGIPRVGKITAGGWLNKIHLNNCPEEVLSKYIFSYRDIPKAIFEYQKNYRLLYLLRTNQDFIRECNALPITPEFNHVVRDLQNENLEF